MSVEMVLALIGDYYGLDWLTLILGVSASYLISNAGKLYTGLAVGTIACAGGLSVAMMSEQHGFVVYNMILMGLNTRGMYLGYRKNAATRASLTPPADVSVSVPAR